MKKNSVKVNYLFNVGYQIFALLVPLITTPYISRILTPSGIGVYSYTYSIVRYFWILSILGIATYGIKIIGINQENKKERSKSFWEILIFKVITSCVMIVLYYIYVTIYAENKMISYIQGIYLIGVMIDISWFFQGMEDFKKIATRNFCVKLINVIYIFMVIKSSNDLWKYVFGLSFFTFLGNLVVWISLPKYIQKVDIKELKPFKHTKTIIQLFIPTLANQIYAILDKSMIGWITRDLNENGYYEQALKIVDMSLVLITTLSSVMIPKISREYANKNFEKVKLDLLKSYKFVWLLAIPMMFGCIGISDILVPIFFGPGYDKVIILLPILSLLFIFMGMNYTTGTQYLISTGKQNKYNKFLIIGGICNVVLNLILIKSLKSIGAAIASITGEFIIMILCFRYLQKTNEFEVKKIFEVSYKYIFSGIGMLISIQLLKNILDPSVTSLVVIILTAIIIYFGILIVLKEDIVRQGIELIKMKLKIKEKK